MWDCPAEHCAGFAWRYTSPLLPGETRPQHPIREREFGLFANKFSAELLRRMPNPMAGASLRWTQVDLCLLSALRQHGAEPCVHEPDVVNLRQEHPSWVQQIADSEWVDA